MAKIPWKAESLIKLIQMLAWVVVLAFASLVTSKSTVAAERQLASHDTALGALKQAGFLDEPFQIPATVVDVGILKFVPYMSYRIGADRELNIYGDPQQPACIEIGLYRSLLSAREEKLRCGALFQSVFPGLDLGSVRLTGGRSMKGNWVIEVTMPDAPDAYGGWWVSIYNLERLHQAAGTSANVSTVSEPPASSQDWSPQELSYSRPSSSSSSSHRVYVRSYFRKDGTYVRAHTRSK